MSIKLYQQIISYLRTSSTRTLAFLIPCAIIISSVLSIAIIKLQSVLQEPVEHGQSLTIAHYVAISFALLLFVFLKVRSRRSHSPHELNRPFAKSLILSISMGVLLFPVPIYLLVWQTHYDQIEWYYYSFYDKRWLLASYWLSVLTFLILPPFFSKLLAQQNFSNSSNDSCVDSQNNTREPRNSSALSRTAKIILPLLIAFLLFGPPWNIHRTPLIIDFHEQVHLGPLQAIHEGYIPNIGPASQQYGPGTQLITYAYMDWSNQFNLVGFREAQGLIYLLGYSLFAVLAFHFLRWQWALFALLLSFTVSPFTLIMGWWSLGWWTDGGLAVWGRANPLRYMGSLVFAAFLPSIILIRYRPHLLTIFAGFIWGMFCWIAQENLIMGVATGAIVFTLAWVTGTIRLRDGLYRVGWISLGFLIFWLPILWFYGSQGLAQTYVSNMLLVGGQVIRGFSNIPMSPGIFDNFYLVNLLCLLLPFLIISGLVVLYKNFSLCRPLSQMRLTIIALISVTIANFFSSWTRTDTEHILNTLISVPILLALIVQEFPIMLAHSGLKRWLLSGCLVALVLLFSWNPGVHNITWYQQILTNPLQKFTVADPSGPTIPVGQSPAFDRIGYYQIAPEEQLLREPPVFVADLLAAMDSLHTLEGEVYVHSFPHTSPGLVYFLADLYPPPIYLDPLTMVFSEDVMRLFMQQFETIIYDVDHIISTQLDVPEVEVFLAANEEATIQEYTFEGQTYYIISRL